jgi:hypothetical protein
MEKVLNTVCRGREFVPVCEAALRGVAAATAVEGNGAREGVCNLVLVVVEPVVVVTGVLDSSGI